MTSRYTIEVHYWRKSRTRRRRSRGSDSPLKYDHKGVMRRLRRVFCGRRRRRTMVDYFVRFVRRIQMS